MLPPPNPTDPAFLFVLAEPGHISTAEFNDWYDNEHVPLRMAHIPEFLTGARYVATDVLKPSYAAAYEIEAVSLFSHDKYTRLRANRSPREADLVIRLETLDRRTCVKVDETSVGHRAKDTPKFLATIAGDEELTGNGRELEHVKGWRRSHRHKTFDSLLIGARKQPVENGAPQFITIHEFDDESYVDSEDWKKASKGRHEVRRWKLLKATDNTA